MSEVFEGLQGEDLEDKIRELVAKGEMKLQKIADLGQIEGI